MRNRPWPEDLDSYSLLIGVNTFLVQGPGGNTSFKDGKIMWVKASGTRLSEAVAKEIFAGVNVVTGEPVETLNELRPSIEKDFHLLIPFPYVIHTHSLRAISMGIENNFGSKRSIFPLFAFVPYARPGSDLCNLIAQEIDFKVHSAAILQNHGFLTWGNTMEEAYKKLALFEGEISVPDSAEKLEAGINMDLLHPKAVTPDYAVFLSTVTKKEIMDFSGKNLWKKQMYLVAQKAAALLEENVNVNYLSDEEVNSLQNWESEKFRVAANE
jgi:rhamnose utilization protein RhaD (predicted bifunctional aldolase and dehydrogenase)